MKISTKGRYGIRAMFFLAQGENVISLKELSGKTGVTEPYLEKIMGILRKKDLISAVRGAGGGYSLSRSPKEITIGEILRALENNMYLTSCNGGTCKSRNCPSKNVFNKIYVEINKVLDNIYLADMLDGNIEG